MTYIANTQRTSEKSQANGYAALDAGTKVPTAELGDASANVTTFLRGDRAWTIPGLSVPTQIQSGPVTYAATTNDYVIRADCTGGIVQIDLPDASGNSGKVYILKKIDASGNALHYVAGGADTIDGDSSGNLTVRYDAISVVANETGSWDII
jgi:hypothetical protein